MIVLSLPYPPSSNNNTAAVGGRRISTRAYRQWRAAAEAAAISQAKGARIAGPYEVRYVAQRPDRRRRDVENLPKSLADALQAAGVIRDDADCQRSQIEWSAAPPCKPALVFITLLPAEAA